MVTGKSFSKSLVDVVQAIKFRTSRVSRELIKLVLHPRNDSVRPFINILDSMSKQENFKFSVEWVNRMLFIYRDIQLKELGNILWHIINTDTSRLQMYDAELVKQYMEDYAKSQLMMESHWTFFFCMRWLLFRFFLCTSPSGVLDEHKIFHIIFLQQPFRWLFFILSKNVKKISNPKNFWIKIYIEKWLSFNLVKFNGMGMVVCWIVVWLGMSWN